MGHEQAFVTLNIGEFCINALKSRKCFLNVKVTNSFFI